jgi:RNA polymerase sigma-70 factor, ECF subfamily
LLNDDVKSLFQRWLMEQGGAVFKVARAYTHTAEDAQDLVQEILLQVWRSLPQFKGRASVSTWIYRIALNTALTWRRQARRRPERQPLFEIEELTADDSESAKQVEQREVVEGLYAAIRQLPKGDAALVLLYLDDLSYREMAEVLGISESNVGVKLNRAKNALRVLMNEVSHES